MLLCLFLTISYGFQFFKFIIVFSSVNNFEFVLLICFRYNTVAAIDALGLDTLLSISYQHGGLSTTKQCKVYVIKCVKASFISFRTVKKCSKQFLFIY